MRPIQRAWEQISLSQLHLPEFLMQWVWGAGVRIRISSKAMRLLLLLWGLHFENHWPIASGTTGPRWSMISGESRLPFPSDTESSWHSQTNILSLELVISKKDLSNFHKNFKTMTLALHELPAYPWANHWCSPWGNLILWPGSHDSPCGGQAPFVTDSSPACPTFRILSKGRNVGQIECIFKNIFQSIYLPTYLPTYLSAYPPIHLGQLLNLSEPHVIYPDKWFYNTYLSGPLWGLEILPA